MKLRELLNFLQALAVKEGTSPVFLTGGTPRDKMLGIIKDKAFDLDLTTGDSSIHYLAQAFALDLSKQYAIESKKMDDGHTSVFVGNLKVDFSSNFLIPRIKELLIQQGIKQPTDLQQEMFSRDFTCNALLMTLDLKTIKDPTNRGFADIEKRILKTCLDPAITFYYNQNRIIRTLYLSAKLDFDVDPSIIAWIAKHKQYLANLSETYLKRNIDKAFTANPERAVNLIQKTDLWDALPMTDNFFPYWQKRNNVKVGQLKRNFDYGEGMYAEMNEGKIDSVSDFRKKRRKKRKKILKQIRDMKLK